jgi:hypothetical protein
MMRRVSFSRERLEAVGRLEAFGRFEAVEALETDWDEARFARVSSVVARGIYPFRPLSGFTETLQCEPRLQSR